MSKFAKMNKVRSTVNEKIKTDEFEFKPLRDFVGKTLHVFGFFFTKGDYGKQVVIVTDNELINMPSRAVADFDEILSQEDIIESIVNGEMAIKVTKEIKTKQGRTVAYEYCDWE